MAAEPTPEAPSIDLVRLCRHLNAKPLRIGTAHISWVMRRNYRTDDKTPRDTCGVSAITVEHGAIPQLYMEFAHTMIHPNGTLHYSPILTSVLKVSAPEVLQPHAATDNTAAAKDVYRRLCGALRALTELTDIGKVGA